MDAASGASDLGDRGHAAPGSIPARGLSSFLGHFTPTRSQCRGALGVLMSAALVGSAVLSTSSATAAPKPTVSEVQRKIDKLHEEQEKASEAFNDTREELKSVNVRLKAARTKLARQRVEMAKAKEKLGLLASETYRRGELSTLGLVLGDNPDMALAQAGYLPSLSERQARAMQSLRDGEAKLLATETEIKDQKAKIEAGKAKLAKNRATVKKRLSEADAQLNRLTAAQQVSLQQAQNSGGPAGGGAAFCNGKSVQAPSGAAKAAISFACQQLGEPYVWAAAGPGSWDCSGLTMKAYAAGGVSLPHSSRLQAGYGTPVSSSNLLAGDLVFFNSPISHVGIYLGDGMMVHAPNSSTVVKVADMYKAPSAAVRLG